jgi:hypothetical protein
MYADEPTVHSEDMQKLRRIAGAPADFGDAATGIKCTAGVVRANYAANPLPPMRAVDMFEYGQEKPVCPSRKRHQVGRTAVFRSRLYARGSPRVGNCLNSFNSRSTPTVGGHSCESFRSEALERAGVDGLKRPMR